VTLSKLFRVMLHPQNQATKDKKQKAGDIFHFEFIHSVYNPLGFVGARSVPKSYLNT
jgi:hypothetical protein